MEVLLLHAVMEEYHPRDVHHRITETTAVRLFRDEVHPTGYHLRERELSTVREEHTMQDREGP